MIQNFVLIIGAMKSGTTSLYNYLAQHPEIAECRTKEVNFFGKPHRFERGFSFYQNLWDWNPRIHKYALEATPAYTRVTHPQLQNAAENIAQVKQETGANFKFIYIVRDPIDRIESHLTHGRKHKYENALRPLEEGVHSEIVDTSKYAMQIKEYYDRFPENDILLVNFEDLKQAPLSQMKNICQFLEVDRNYTFPNLDDAYNSYTKDASRIMLPGYSRFRKSKFVKESLKFSSKGLKQKIRAARNLLASGYKHEYVKLSVEQRDNVLAELSDDLEKLQKTYKFDTSNWNI